MTTYTIGIDTGGTYTDAALMDARARRLVAKAKALTTRGDLAVGVTQALAAVLDEATAQGLAVAGADISLVALSTTLATNAIVEGHGSPVGVILIGFGDRMAARTGITQALKDAHIRLVDGGHDHAGSERSPLDMAALEGAIDELAGRVEAFAIAAHYSVRNPTHERLARAAVHDRCRLPVTISSELAEALDAPRRALTAALNARIVSRITHLIEAVRRGMAEHGIAAPLMIVKGDGTLASADIVAERPIETVLSGPAASVIGAKFLSGLADFVISDLGGTTTDVATLKGGWPRLNREGAVVGGWRTMVNAIDMTTLGLGGDSEVAMDGPGAVTLKPDRVVPVALLGALWPHLVPRMKLMLLDPEGTRHGGRFALRPAGTAAGAGTADLSNAEREVFGRIGGEPVPLHEVVFGLADQRALARLAKRGIVQIAAFTPSDAAHVLGLQDQWSREAAVLAALLLKRSRRMIRANEGEREARDFAAEAAEAVVRKSTRVLVETLGGCRFDDEDRLVGAVVSGATALNGLGIALTPTVPIVAVGGPAPIFYPEVGRRLNCEVVLPEDGDVANAVGAAVALVKVQAVVEITSNGKGSYRIHHDGEPERAAGAGAALERAREIATATARDRALSMGGNADGVDVHVERIDVPESVGDAGLIAATVVAECWGVPAV